MQAQIDLKDMENRLRERKNVLVEQLDIESKKVLPAGMSGQDNADLAYDYEFRSHQEIKLNRLDYQINEVNKALNRIKDGVYSICTNCKKTINSDRLQALPYAEHCIDCERLKVGA